MNFFGLAFLCCFVELCKYGSSIIKPHMGGYTFQGSAISQIYNAINTPTIHYNGWHSSNPDSWTRANYPTSLTSKSIFDPCPYGYRVPTSNADSKGNSDFFGFPKPASWSVNIINGQSWLGSWWPASGLRYYNSAAITNIGGGLYCWSASPDTIYFVSAYFLSFSSGDVTPVHYTSRSHGMSVRCVQE